MWTGIVLGTLGVLSRENWRSIWLMLEVNLISFLPLISYSWSVKKVTIIYFLAQRVGSLSLLIRGIVMDRRHFLYKGLLLGLLLKGGFAPLHFWGPLFINKLPKIQTFTFLSWQKIAPLFLLLASIPKHILCWVLIANALVAALRAISSKRLSVLLFFSGLMHVSWVLMAPQVAGMTYFFLYSLLLFPVVYSTPSTLPVFLFNIAGLPPLSGFFLKLFMLQFVDLGIGALLLFITFFLLYSYIRLFLFIRLKIKVNISALFLCSLGLFYYL